MSETESEGPPLEELVHPTAAEQKRPSVHVGLPYHLPDSPTPVTWRGRLYWRLRKLIDWIHP